MSHPDVGARRRALHRPRLSKALSLLALVALLVASFGSWAVAQPTDCANLIADSGLEQGNGWQSSSSGNYSLVSDFLAYRGGQAAHLAGVDNANDTLAVTLNLPADKPHVNLTFWWRVQSEEESDEFDGLTVIAADAAGTPLRSLMALGSANAAAQWQQSSLDLSDFAGQSIQLQFVAQTDSSLVTDFFIDDVQVTACNAQQYRLFLPLTQN
jgi:hypothetical protein